MQTLFSQWVLVFLAIEKNCNQSGKGRHSRATGNVTYWTGPPFEPEGHGLHVFQNKSAASDDISAAIKEYFDAEHGYDDFL